MNQKELRDLRAMIFGCQIRITNLALMLHKEQDRVQDLINIIDIDIAKGESNVQ